MSKPDLDLNSEEVHANPFETYRRFRETEPVYWSERYQSWFLFRHSDVDAALRHPAVSSERLETFRRLAPPEQAQALAPTFATMERWILFQSGDKHRHRRQLFGHGFTQAAITKLMPVLESVAGNLIGGLRDRAQFDAAAEFAIPFPVTVIGDMFGVAPEDRPRVAHWSDDIAYFLTSIPIPADACERIGPTLSDLATTMEKVVAARRANPRGEFLDELIHAEEDGRVLETADLFANFSLLLLAGNETTRNLIGNGINLLLRQPDALETLQREPKLWENAVNEILRYRSPIQIISRLVVADVEFGGKTLKPGQQVFCLLGAANHDPEIFTEPDRFDIRRKNAGDNVAFGGGPHYCLGHFLAHAEGQIALSRLFEAFPKLKLDPSRPAEVLRDTRLLGFTHLPVSV